MFYTVFTLTASHTATIFTMAEHLEQLTKIFKELSLLAEKQERNMQVYQKKALQLTIAYLVFQAIAFISLTKQAYYSSSGHCHNLWLPFAFSMLSSLMYVLALLSTLAGSYRVGFQLDLNLMEQEIVSKQMLEAERCIK